MRQGRTHWDKDLLRPPWTWTRRLFIFVAVSGAFLPGPSWAQRSPEPADAQRVPEPSDEASSVEAESNLAIPSDNPPGPRVLAETSPLDEAFSFWALGDAESALALLQEAEESPRGGGRDSPLTVDEVIALWRLRASIHAHQGRMDEARQDLARILSVRPTFSFDDHGLNPPVAPPQELEAALFSLRHQVPLLLLSVQIRRSGERVTLEATTQDRAGAGRSVRLRIQTWDDDGEGRWREGEGRLSVAAGGMVHYVAEVIGPGGAILTQEDAMVPGREARAPMDISLPPPPGPRTGLAIQVAIAALSSVAAVVVVALLVDNGDKTNRFSTPVLER